MSRKQIKLTVSPELYERITAKAEAEVLPVSTFVRALTLDWLDAGLNLGEGGIQKVVNQLKQIKHNSKSNIDSNTVAAETTNSELSNLISNNLDQAGNVDQADGVNQVNSVNENDLILLSDVLKSQLQSKQETKQDSEKDVSASAESSFEEKPIHTENPQSHTGKYYRDKDTEISLGGEAGNQINITIRL